MEYVSAQNGVSKKEILDKCGEVKTDAKIEAEMTLVDIEKMIWDIRKSSKPVQTMQVLSGKHITGGGWSSGGNCLVTCVHQLMGRCVAMIYPGQDLSQPDLIWDNP